MDFNFDEAESAEYFKPEEGKRYNLTVSAAKEDVSKVKRTPFLKLSFTNDALENAYDKDIYNTPKALFRAQEWFKALGLAEAGKVSFNPDNLVGIRLTAKCVYESYFTDENDGSKKEHKMVRWEEPLPVKIGKVEAPAGLGTLAPKTEPKAPVSSEEVPF